MHIIDLITSCGVSVPDFLEILENDYDVDPQVPWIIALLVSVGDYTTFLRMMKEYKNNPEAYTVQFQQDALEEVSEKNI